MRNRTRLLKRTSLYYFMQNLPKRIPKRIVLYAKDVENITGKKARTASNLLQKIREQNKKPKSAFVTVKEFCRFTGIQEDEVQEFLLD